MLGISELLEARSEDFYLLHYTLALRCLAAGVMRHVELVVQVVGYTKIPLVPKKGPDLITWYQKVRLLPVHRVLTPNETSALTRHRSA